jgi:MFS family permease
LGPVVSPYLQLREQPAPLAPPTRLRRISSTVVLLGLTSLFTDLAAEMVTAVLPLYLTFQLGFSALQFGIVDGIYQGATALVRVAGGFHADTRQRHKSVATFGYAVGVVTKLALVVGTGWGWITSVLLVDRLGKGLRTSPRDAMISLSSRADTLGESFGVHRTLDTVGALLGPLMAFIVLTQTPDQYDVVFVVSFCFATVGLAIIALFVREPKIIPTDSPRRRMWTEARALLHEQQFRQLTITAAALSLLTISEPFVYLVIQDAAGLSVRWFPLLFVGTAVSYLVLAVPAGRLADRIGRTRVFVGSFGLLVLVYALLGFSSLAPLEVLVVLVLMGAFAAGTDGVLMATAAPLLGRDRQATGLAVITSTTAIARFGSSVAFGAVWLAWGWQVAVVSFLVGLMLLLPVAAHGLAVRTRT